MKLKIFAAVSALAMIFALSFTACGERKETPIIEFDYKFTNIEENGETVGYKLDGFADGVSYSEVVIPDSHNGKPVTVISEKAFYCNSEIVSVRVSDSVKTVGKEAFYGCENLKSVTLGKETVSVGELSFADCPALETVNFGEKLKSIESYAFSQCVGLSSAVFPSALESIGECAFVGCENLERAVLNDGLKTIADCAFGGCKLLKEFIMPDSVASIGWGVIMFEAGSVGFVPPGDSSNNLTKIVISDNISEIPDFAFSKSNIASARIGKKVRTIRYSSFYGCGLLENVIIPVSVAKIESYAFYKCESLSSVYYEGTAEEWAKISIGKNGNDVSTADKFFYSETRPETDGNYWRYVDGVPVKW